jgi:hypothetical protein
MAENLVKNIRKHDEGRTLRLKITRKDIIKGEAKKISIDFKKLDEKNRGKGKGFKLDALILEQKSKKCCCLCCCHIPSDLFMFYIPISYDDGEFNVRPQHFCSFDCASSYCDKELKGEHNAKCMLSIYHKKFSDNTLGDLTFNVPSPFKNLICFGGQYTEEEFHKRFIHNTINLMEAKNKGKNIKITIMKTHQRISDDFYAQSKISFSDLYDKLTMETELEKIATGKSRYFVEEYDYSEQSTFISFLPSDKKDENQRQTYEDKIYEKEEQRLIEEGKLCKREVFFLKDLVKILPIKKRKKKSKELSAKRREEKGEEKKEEKEEEKKKKEKLKKKKEKLKKKKEKSKKKKEKSKKKKK